MKPPYRPLFPAAALALAFGSLATAQGDTGFLRGKGHYDSAFSYTLDYYDEFWVGEDSMSPPDVGEVQRETASLYFAYGLTDDLDLVANANYVESETDGIAPFEDQDDLQDFYLGVKWRALQTANGSFSALLAPSLKVPMTSYENDDVTAIGDGQVDLRLRAILHYQWRSFWASLESGYDLRQEAPENEVPVNLTLGGTIAERVTVMPFYSLVRSEDGFDISDMGDPDFSFPGLEEEYDRAGVSVYARLTQHVGITALWRTTLDGMNTGEADAWGFGLVYGR